VTPNTLALLAWLKSFQYLGYFPGLHEVPGPVLAQVRSALGLAEDVRAEVDADRTGKRYRENIRLRLGVKSDKAASRDVAEAAVRAAAQSKDNPADLINVAIEHLVRRRLELPGYSTPRWTGWSPGSAPRSTRACSGRSRQGSRLTAGLLVADPATRRSPFDRLKDPARAATTGKLKARLKHLADLDAIGPTEAWLAGVPMAKAGHFAGEARLTDAADMKKPGEGWGGRAADAAGGDGPYPAGQRAGRGDRHVLQAHGDHPPQGPGAAGGTARGAPCRVRAAAGGGRRRPGRGPRGDGRRRGQRRGRHGRWGGERGRRILRSGFGPTEVARHMRGVSAHDIFPVGVWSSGEGALVATRDVYTLEVTGSMPPAVSRCGSPRRVSGCQERGGDLR
jgi:hypothetical protein